MATTLPRCLGGVTTLHKQNLGPSRIKGDTIVKQPPVGFSLTRNQIRVGLKLRPPNSGPPPKKNYPGVCRHCQSYRAIQLVDSQLDKDLSQNRPSKSGTFSIHVDPRLINPAWRPWCLGLVGINIGGEHPPNRGQQCPPKHRKGQPLNGRPGHLEVSIDLESADLDSGPARKACQLPTNWDVTTWKVGLPCLGQRIRTPEKGLASW